MGFLHTALLMVQASLMFNRAHLNLYWRVILESWGMFRKGFCDELVFRYVLTPNTRVFRPTRVPIRSDAPNARRQSRFTPAS